MTRRRGMSAARFQRAGAGAVGRFNEVWSTFPLSFFLFRVDFPSFFFGGEGG